MIIVEHIVYTYLKGGPKHIWKTSWRATYILII